MTEKQHVARLSDIPENQGLRVEIGDRVVAVFRVGQKLFAVGDSCPHMGASLAEGYLDGNTVICPWHGWVFDLETGTSPFDEEATVPTYRVGVENGEVYLEVDSSAGTGCPSPSPSDPRRS